MDPTLPGGSGPILGYLAALITDGPWRSKTVIAAFAVVVLGLGLWVGDLFKGSRAGTESRAIAYRGSGFDFSRPLPGYVRVCASYIGGFLLGWTLRRFVKITALSVMIIVALLGSAKLAGCDSSALQQRVEHDAAAIKQEAGRERDHLKGLLPSTTGAGLGVFWGFRRRSRTLATLSPGSV